MNRNTSKSFWSCAKPRLDYKAKSRLPQGCARQSVVNAAQSNTRLIFRSPRPCSESQLVHICLKTAAIQPLSYHSRFSAIDVRRGGKKRSAFVRTRCAVKVLQHKFHLTPIRVGQGCQRPGKCLAKIAQPNDP